MFFPNRRARTIFAQNFNMNKCLNVTFETSLLSNSFRIAIYLNMKKSFIVFLFLTVVGFLFGQSLEGFNYQAVIRNSDGSILANRVIGARISILQGSTNGTSLCTEAFNETTNDYGLVNLKIGSSNKQSFEDIDWSNGSYFLKIDIDLNGGTDYKTMGTSQLLSVPFALYAKKSGNIEVDPTFNNHPAKGISNTNIANWNTAHSWGSHHGLYRSISYTPTWAEVSGKPSLATVATSGSYNDLTNKPAGTNVGDMQYWNGTEWVAVPVGQPGQYLQLNTSGVPAWSGTAYASIGTASASSITQTAAVSGGNITSDGGTSITSRGVCWSTSPNPTIANSKTNDGLGTGSFVSNITGLNAETSYYVRAYATNAVGTIYGNAVSFTTTKPLATVTTGGVSSVTANSAIVAGNVVANGSSAVTERGVCWSISANPTIANSKVIGGSGTGSYTCNLTGLSAKTEYHARAYATNSSGTAYGSDITFTTEGVTEADNSHLLLGNPSNATAEVANENNYLLEKPQYIMSYNNSSLIPNWVSWHLYPGDIGSTKRQDNFRADIDLPSGWYHVGSSDYQYSTYGFDRGHMCPSADRTLSVADNSATFLMSNMIPQAPNNNQQTWGNLENYCRTLIDAGNELYIICGPHGQGGASTKGTFSSISVNSGANSITVPNKTWKIIVVLPNGDNDLSRITVSTRVIAVVMPNDQTCNSKPWYDYRANVNSIETLTGYDFFSNVSTTIQEEIEENVDNITIQ